MHKSKRKIPAGTTALSGRYLDYASGTEANPSALHELGAAEKRKLEDARARVAKVLGAHPDEIIFTSGGTESNNLAVLGMPPGVMVTTNIEHASVLEPAKKRKAVFMPVGETGLIDSRKIRAALSRNTILISVMYANNEIGTIQPLREIAKEIRHWNKNRRNKIYFHTDAVQAVNYLQLGVEKLGVDMLSLNAAKIYGPRGIGALYVRRGTPLGPILLGGEQERGLRPGTENVAGATALAECLEQAEKIKKSEVKRLTTLRDYFARQLTARFNLAVNGDLTKRLPNNVNITVPGIPSDLLVLELSARGIYASAKSACKSGDGKASHVVAAINPKIKDTDGSLRFSLGRETKKSDIDYTLKALSEILKKLKKWYI